MTSWRVMQWGLSGMEVTHRRRLGSGAGLLPGRPGMVLLALLAVRRGVLDLRRLRQRLEMGGESPSRPLWPSAGWMAPGWCRRSFRWKLKSSVAYEP